MVSTLPGPASRGHEQRSKSRENFAVTISSTFSFPTVTMETFKPVEQPAKDDAACGIRSTPRALPLA